MAGVDAFDVEVIYALARRQRIVSVRVRSGASIEEAVRQSGILAEFPQIDFGTAKLGVFSRPVEAHDRVKPGDRIEIYRPLRIDPKSVRRLRAGTKKEPRAR